MTPSRSLTVLAFGLLHSCTVYDPSLLDTHAGVTGSSGGSDDTAGATTGGANGGGSNEAHAGSGNSTATTGGVSQGGSGSGTGSTGSSGAGNGGRAGNGGSGSTGSASAGSTGAGSAGAGSTSSGGAGPAGGATGSAGATGDGGSTSINPCDRTNWRATASEASLSMDPIQLYNPPVQAIDGVPSSRWSTGMAQVGGEWFLVDLGARAAHLTQVVLDTTGWPTDAPAGYRLETSVNGKSFATVSTGAGAAMTTINFVDTPARYIRVVQTGISANQTWWSIQEITLMCSPN